ncbi:transposase [Streptomyces olivochromogenes]|uniref:transposase n=1 Tax=Streptomyces olivochromogenes TaxID=1963 RepID=UPI0036A246F2
MDTINVKIRDAQVADRPVYVVMAVTVDGTRDILGTWTGDGGEGPSTGCRCSPSRRTAGSMMC